MRFDNVVFILTIAFAASLVQAVPVARLHEAKRDVVDPQITSPASGTVWVVGTTATVTWDTSELTNATTSTGTILLGYLNSSSTDEHLMTSSPLASGFNLTAGSTTVTVPDVADGLNYIIALLGDSGNISPTFTITSSSSSSSSLSSTSGSTSDNDAASSSSASVSVSASTTLPASILSTASSTTTGSVATSSASASSGSNSQSNGLSTLSIATSSATESASSSSSGSTSGALSNVPLSRFAHFAIPLLAVAVFVF